VSQLAHLDRYWRPVVFELEQQAREPFSRKVLAEREPYLHRSIAPVVDDRGRGRVNVG